MKRKRLFDKRVNPKRLITTLTQTFKETLTKPQLKNSLLSCMAIAMSQSFRINEIARHLPVAVKTEKTKQKRLLRFIGSQYPTQQVLEKWLPFVLGKVYKTAESNVLILIDETPLIGDYKAIVAAIPFRQQAIPIAFLVYSDDQIRQMKYTSHNTLVQQFCKSVYQQAKAALPLGCQPILVFDRGFARARYLIKWFDDREIPFLIRVCKNSGLEVEGRVTTLREIKTTGFYPDIIYHRTQRIELHLFVVRDESFDDPMFIVSNCQQGLAIYLCYKRRMQIEHGFRALKSTFGFGSLVLKIATSSRVELLWLLLCLTYGLLVLQYEKSAYRWAKQFNSPRKTKSLIWVIKDVISRCYNRFKLSPFFTLPLLEADFLEAGP